MARKKTPKANIHWHQIKPGMCVRDEGSYFSVQVTKTKRAVANWSSTDARQAQNDLKHRASTGVYCPRK